MSPPHQKAFAPRLTPFLFVPPGSCAKILREPQCLGERREVQEVAPYPPHHSLLQLLNLEPAYPPLAALCAPTFLPPEKGRYTGASSKRYCLSFTAFALFYDLQDICPYLSAYLWPLQMHNFRSFALCLTIPALFACTV